MNLSQRVPGRWRGTLVSLALLVVTPTGLARGESSVSVDYQAPRLSVEARDTSLAAVLSAIGARVGFSVVEIGRSSAMATFSVKDAAVEDILGRLLRMENHTVLYRAGTDSTAEDVMIDRIVLLGEPGASNPPEASAGPVETPHPRGSVASDRTPGSAATPPGLLTAPESRPDWPPLISWDRVASWDRSTLPEGPGDPGMPPITVGDLLKTHAIAAAPPATSPGVSAAGAPAPPIPAPANLDVTLAETTRRAQQALGALMDGLAVATRSLYQSRSGSGK